MSYDLRLGVKVEGLDVIAVIDMPEKHSPTYNLAKVFRQSTGWNFEQGTWYRVSDVLPYIKQGISELIVNHAKYKKLEPDNGWGTISSARETLISLLDCIEHQYSDYTWQNIPPEHLWVCW